MISDIRIHVLVVVCCIAMTSAVVASEGDKKGAAASKKNEVLKAGSKKAVVLKQVCVIDIQTITSEPTFNILREAMRNDLPVRLKNGNKDVGTGVYQAVALQVPVADMCCAEYLFDPVDTPMPQMKVPKDRLTVEAEKNAEGAFKIKWYIGDEEPASKE